MNEASNSNPTRGGSDRPTSQGSLPSNRLAQFSTRPVSNRWVWIAFFVLVVLPIYAIAVMACIRSGLFKFTEATFNNDQLKAVWTFLAAGLTATVTVLGALLTKSHNDRTLAFQAESASRQQTLEDETAKRLNMDTVINGLNLIAHDDKYAPKAAMAGGMATLVQLGHPIVAMRALAAALQDDEAVDKDTATWLISQVLTTTNTTGTEADLQAAKEEAANLLLRHARTFTIADSDTPDYFWPEAVTTQWPTGLPLNAANNIVRALVEILLSQTKEWWVSGDFSYSWIIFTLDEVVRNERHATVRGGAATFRAFPG